MCRAMALESFTPGGCCVVSGRRQLGQGRTRSLNTPYSSYMVALITAMKLHLVITMKGAIFIFPRRCGSNDCVLDGLPQCVG